MNTSASTLLRALSTVGVRSVRFRILSQSDINKHTTPIAVLDDENENVHGHRMPKFSISDLFSAYALTPRKGYYTLEVDQGQLSFMPPKLRPVPQLEQPHASAGVKKRWKPKISRRRLRVKSSRARKFPSA